MRIATPSLVLAASALLLVACGGPTVQAADLVGTWRSDDGSGAEIDLSADGCCSVRDIAKSIVGPPDATGSITTSGVWELGDPQGGLEVFMDLRDLPAEGRRYRSLLWVRGSKSAPELQHWVDDEGFETVDFRRVGE